MLPSCFEPHHPPSASPFHCTNLLVSNAHSLHIRTSSTLTAASNLSQSTTSYILASHFLRCYFILKCEPERGLLWLCALGRADLGRERPGPPQVTPARVAPDGDDTLGRRQRAFWMHLQRFHWYHHRSQEARRSLPILGGPKPTPIDGTGNPPLSLPTISNSSSFPSPPPASFPPASYTHTQRASSALLAAPLADFDTPSQPRTRPVSYDANKDVDDDKEEEDRLMSAAEPGHIVSIPFTNQSATGSTARHLRPIRSRRLYWFNLSLSTACPTSPIAPNQHTTLSFVPLPVTQHFS
ncbi:hypothetical protein PTTG_00801 [Puccinia triticina 1-1 BBBD Race 1]|uniref:Uncharacterized protein n=2 Tax=Puccinia triticina TaxID=208348 RepID=A0A0C4EJ84_PUCT1|nr:hypothetical protein PTTG_00801 [Puccinia triticina 1-1 BBBD Race 1]